MYLIWEPDLFKSIVWLVYPRQTVAICECICACAAAAASCTWVKAKVFPRHLAFLGPLHNARFDPFWFCNQIDGICGGGGCNSQLNSLLVLRTGTAWISQVVKLI